MRFEPTNLGFATADGEQVSLDYDGGALTLRFKDWQEQAVQMVFPDVLAFRWGLEASSDAPRDDMTYEVMDSHELAREIELNSIANAGGYAHYRLCFNACGVLDVLCARISSGCNPGSLLP